MEGSIKFNSIGRIIEGENSGWFIKIIDDKQNTGGYYIYQANNESFIKGYDDWLETIDAVRQYIQESNWVIDWSNASD